MKVTCIVCPVGCEIDVIPKGEDALEVSGFSCKRGEEYAILEFKNPVRILTSIVRVESEDFPTVAVRSRGKIPKDLQLRCMDEIKKVKLKPPINRNEVVIRDILNTGIDIITTGNAK